MARRFESLEEARARREEVMDEAAELNGFDLLLQEKARLLDVMAGLIKQHPHITRKDIKERTGLSLRTVTRYLRILRSQKRIPFNTVSDFQIKQRKNNLIKLKKLVFQHPEWMKKQYAESLGVSTWTLMSYFKELK